MEGRQAGRQRNGEEIEGVEGVRRDAGGVAGGGKGGSSMRSMNDGPSKGVK